MVTRREVIYQRCWTMRRSCSNFSRPVAVMLKLFLVRTAADNAAGRGPAAGQTTGPGGCRVPGLRLAPAPDPDATMHQDYSDSHFTVDEIHRPSRQARWDSRPDDRTRTGPGAPVCVPGLDRLVRADRAGPRRQQPHGHPPRAQEPGNGSQSCAATGPEPRPGWSTSLMRVIRGQASSRKQVREARHHTGLRT